MASRAPRSPLNAEIDEALRAVVNDDSLDSNELTIRKIRTIAEQRLGLPVGYLKNDKKWNTKSRDIIDSAWADKSTLQDAGSQVDIEQTTLIEPTGQNKKRRQQEEQSARKRPKKATAAKSDGSGGKQSAKAAPTRRRRPVVHSEEDEDEDEDEEDQQEPTFPVSGHSEQVAQVDQAVGALRSTQKEENPLEASPKAKYDKATAATAEDEASDSELSSLIDEPPIIKRKNIAKPTKGPGKAPPKAPAKSESDSELSSLVDEDTPPTKPKRSSKKEARAKEGTAKEAKAQKAKAQKAKASAADDDAVKTLQSQLLKCGVRKQWKRELAGCATEREMVEHLRRLLADVGMTGRFSERKAKEIKERRFLEQELRDAEEFSRHYGLEASLDGGRKRKSAAHMYDELGFGSSDGE